MNSDPLWLEAIRLFREGKDTVAIARALDVTEAVACDLIAAARQAEKFGGSHAGEVGKASRQVRTVDVVRHSAPQRGAGAR